MIKDVYHCNSCTFAGEAPYWRGVNSQTSMSAKVQVRCWSETRLPEPCFHVEDLYMLAGSSDGEYISGFPIAAEDT